MRVDWTQVLTDEQLDACIGILDDFLGVEKVWDYRPYPKQREFHAMGRREKRNRLLRAGNWPVPPRPAGQDLLGGA